MGVEAKRVYIVLGVVTSSAMTLAFSLTTLFRLRVAGLDPFQLIIVGTVMEAAVFVFEIPTGIVADLYSRKVSIVIGHIGMGAAFLLEGSVSSFPGVLVAQALWGVAYTFTSGATMAWIAGEMGEPDERALSSLFLRTSQWGSAATVVMIPAAFLLAQTSLRVPLIVAGVAQVMLGGWLALAMPEEHFERAAPGERGTWGRMATTARDGFGAIRASSVLVLLVMVIAISGAASEAYDRYAQPMLIGPIGLPSAFGGSELVWLAVISTASAALGIVIPMLVCRSNPAATRKRLGRWVFWLYALHVVGLLVFALTGSIVLGFAAVLVIDRASSVRYSLFGSWIIPLTPKAQRATVLSALSQADAVGQIVIGPVFGMIGRSAGIPTALVASAGAMTPGLAVIRRAERAGRTGRPPSPESAAGAISEAGTDPMSDRRVEPTP